MHILGMSALRKSDSAYKWGIVPFSVSVGSPFHKDGAEFNSRWQ